MSKKGFDNTANIEFGRAMAETYERITRSNAEMMDFYAELHDESSRAVAILAVAKIDEELSTVISRFFPADIDKEVWNDLIGAKGIISTFRHKRIMAQALGAFGPRTRKAIAQMGAIRNKFAHWSDIRSFKHPKVLKLCVELGGNPVFPYELNNTSSEREIRGSFITTALCLHQRLEMIAPQVNGLGDFQGPLP